MAVKGHDTDFPAARTLLRFNAPKVPEPKQAILLGTARHASRASAEDRIAAMKYRDLVTTLKADGWYEVRSNRSHHISAHPTKPSSFPVPYQQPRIGRAESKRTSILKQAGLK